MESSRRVNRVSWRQLEILWEFLNSNKSLATAHNRSLQAKEYSRKKWQEVANILNAQGDGAHKNWTGWSKYWIGYKNKIKKRVALLRASRVQTGGGPSTEKPLTEIEQKFLQILGDDFGQGLPGVQVELPPEIGAASADVDVHDSPASESILRNVHSLLDPRFLNLTPNSPTEVILEPQLPQNSSLEPLVQDPPAHSPRRSHTPRHVTSSTVLSPRHATTSAVWSPRHATASAVCSPRHQRRRREPLMSQEAARRALVRSSQLHAEGTVRIAEAMEQMVQTTAALLNAATRIERILSAAFPTAAVQEFGE